MRSVLATCRLQLHRDFPLERAAGLVDHLDRLGVTHVHASPILAARPGSTHGYDVTDPGRLNPELGDAAALERLVAALHARGMGLVLDIVPNHMATARENWRWDDLLRHGRRSAFAKWFDVEWRGGPGTPRHRGRVLLPILGDRLNRVLERDELALVEENGELRVRYHEHSFPLDPATVSAEIRADPAGWTAGPEGRKRLRRLLDRQAYRLVHWRRAAREINYRRFFDINDLIALRMEDPAVFQEHHALVLDWYRRGLVDGFRVDHPDGLLDPAAYFARLAEAMGAPRNQEPSPAVPPSRRPAVIWAEKILAPHEHLPPWPIAGTTGYDFANEAEALFVDPAGFQRLVADYHRVLRRPADFGTAARLGKRKVLETALSSGVGQLAYRLRRLADRAGERFTLGALVRAIVELAVYLPVYRTYVSPARPVLEGDDLDVLERALTAARTKGRADPAALDVLGSLLLGTLLGSDPERLEFIQRWQQLTGPAAAKGVEDTALYQYLPLLSRNEVGAEPDLPLDDAVAAFHERAGERAAKWPRAMLVVTTHDTKRGADVRSRLDVLSELPGLWEKHLYQWRRRNRALKTREGRTRPEANTVWLFWQTLAGIWPLELALPEARLPDETCLESLRERMRGYMEKAVREAKVHTSWTEPDQEYEAALARYVDGVLHPDNRQTLLELSRFTARIARPGMWNALARVTLQLTSPGVPDVYQGDELWNFTLVDPDNRRPVDWERRRALALELEEAQVSRAGDLSLYRDLVANAHDGRIKLYFYMKLLGLRRRLPGLFLEGSYEPVYAEGPDAHRVVAFLRRHEGTALLVAVPRLSAGRSPAELELSLHLPNGYDDPSAWTGELVAGGIGSFAARELFGELPAAVLVG